VSVLDALAAFTLPQLASFFPLIEAELVDQVLIASSAGRPSTFTLPTRSGKQIPAKQVLSRLRSGGLESPLRPPP